MHSSPDTVSGRLPSVQGRIPSVQGRIRSGAHPRGCLSRWCFFGNITLITRINIYLPRVGPTPAGNYLSRWCFFDNITLLINYKNRSMHLGEGRKAYTWEASAAAKREVSCNALSPAEERRAPGTNWWIKWKILFPQSIEKACHTGEWEGGSDFGVGVVAKSWAFDTKCRSEWEGGWVMDNKLML